MRKMFNICLLCLGFRPRDPTAQAKKKRKAIQKTRRYHQIKEKKDMNVNLEKQNNVAIKTIKGT